MRTRIEAGPRALTLATGLLLMTACASGPPAGDAGAGSVGGAPATRADAPMPPIFQPGAPGQETRTVSVEELNSAEGPGYTDADVRFMQGMIPHHAQALEMTALVRQFATSEAVRQMALRMEISQRDEIALMEDWLRSRGEEVQMPGMGPMSGMSGAAEAHLMPGMLTPAQMEELRNARGMEFDRLFLVYMIQHHQGAIDMVARLFMTPGGGQESSVFKFAEDVDADQSMEIARMQSVLGGLEGRN